MLGLEKANDYTIREYAYEHDFVIVTHDADFYEMSLVYGQPPKIIWLKTGNQSKGTTVNLLLQQQKLIEHSLLIENNACVEIY